jgi:hypothetical protein
VPPGLDILKQQALKRQFLLTRGPHFSAFLTRQTKFFGKTKSLAN